MSRGYGWYRRQLAHRVALTLSLGRAIRPGLYALHTCDNRPCVNPAHLFEGTQAENIADMDAKGRRGFPSTFENTPRGEHHGQAKLTWDSVRLIRDLYRRGWTDRQIAPLVGVQGATVYAVTRFKTWREAAA